MDQNARILFSNLNGNVSDISKEDFLKFLSNVQLDRNGCFTWLGTINNFGYGQVSHNIVTDGTDHNGKAAHRLAYRIFKGVIPEKFDVDHLCYNRACVNPSHLEAVSHRVNSQRAYERKKALSFVSAYVMGVAA